jgi:hypothetical protein
MRVTALAESSLVTSALTARIIASGAACAAMDCAAQASLLVTVRYRAGGLARAVWCEDHCPSLPRLARPAEVAWVELCAAGGAR